MAVEKCLLLILLAVAATTVWGQDAADLPLLAPKPYRIGIAPSHITSTPDALFQNSEHWSEVRDAIDFYKYYSLQTAPPDWCTRLTPELFVQFTRTHGIAIGAEFGDFHLEAGARPVDRAAEWAVERHRDLVNAGGVLTSLHLDGPVRRLLEGLHENGLPLDRIARELADFLAAVRREHPTVAIGLITNFPNWDYTRALVGFNGHYTDRSGVTYDEALEAVYRAVTRAGDRIAFVEVDCPYNYYRATRTRNDDADLDNAAKFRALQAWCEEREIAFQLIINVEPREENAQTEEEWAAADRRFRDGVLDYIRHLRRDGIFPDGFLIQSWYRAPRRHFPEDEPDTFMNTARDAIRLIRELYPGTETE